MGMASAATGACMEGADCNTRGGIASRCGTTGLKARAGRADKWVMRERRSEVRMLCADMVEAAWRDPAGRTCKTTALLEDICASGACVQLDTPVPLGRRLRLRCGGKTLAGTVRYCRSEERRVGKECRSRWS